MKELEINEEMIARYYALQLQKKEIEGELSQLKKLFHGYFDNQLGANQKGEIIEGRYKLQRQIRVSKKFKEETTVQRLKELNMEDLIQTIKKPDDQKIKAAMNLGLLQEHDLDDCVVTNYSKALSVKEIM